MSFYFGVFFWSIFLLAFATISHPAKAYTKFVLRPKIEYKSNVDIAFLSSCHVFFFRCCCNIPALYNRFHGITSNHWCQNELAKLIRKTQTNIQTERVRERQKILINTKSIELLVEWCHLGVTKIIKHILNKTNK